MCLPAAVVTVPPVPPSRLSTTPNVAVEIDKHARPNTRTGVLRGQIPIGTVLIIHSCGAAGFPVESLMRVVMTNRVIALVALIAAPLVADIAGQASPSGGVV